MVVLLDEVEALAVSRSRASLETNPVDVHRATDAVLSGVDRVARAWPNVTFVATTNYELGVDAAFLSRADLVEHVGTPGAAAVRAILARHDGRAHGHRRHSTDPASTRLAERCAARAWTPARSASSCCGRSAPGRSWPSHPERLTIEDVAAVLEDGSAGPAGRERPTGRRGADGDAEIDRPERQPSRVGTGGPRTGRPGSRSRRIPREAMLLAASMFLLIAATNILTPLLPDIRDDFGVSITTAGLIVGSYGLARLAVDLPAGFLADRVGPRRLSVIAIVVLLASSVLGPGRRPASRCSSPRGSGRASPSASWRPSCCRR